MAAKRECADVALYAAMIHDKLTSMEDEIDEPKPDET